MIRPGCGTAISWTYFRVIKNSDIPAQEVYMRDVNGDWVRHIWSTTEFWRLSPDKQVAIRYQNECQNRHGLDAALPKSGDARHQVSLTRW